MAAPADGLFAGRHSDWCSRYPGRYGRLPHDDRPSERRFNRRNCSEKSARAMFAVASAPQLTSATSQF